MNRARIAILFLEQDRPEDYVISALADYWREDGHAVEYVMGTEKQVRADLLILHVDLSVVPDAYADFARRFPRTVNLGVRDIRKRSFSSMLIENDLSWEGPVIVKTNLNCGGDPEIRYRANPPVHWACRGQRFLFRQWRATRGESSDFPYMICASKNDVPWFCWKNRFWIVEKFVPEKIDDLYAVRTYHFLGNREAFFLLLGRDPIVKSGSVVETRSFEPDHRLRRLRDDLHFDYGKFDYVLVDGEPVLLDVNKTVGLTNRFSRDPLVEKARRERAQGIYDFLT